MWAAGTEGSSGLPEPPHSRIAGIHEDVRVCCMCVCAYVRVRACMCV